jgi:hypothetical protein
MVKFDPKVLLQIFLTVSIAFTLSIRENLRTFLT